MLTLHKGDHYDSLLSKVSSQTGIPDNKFWLSRESKPLENMSQLQNNDTVKLNLQCKGGAFQIVAKTLTGRSYPIVISENNLISEVKELIFEATERDETYMPVI